MPFFICCISLPFLFCVAGQGDLHSHSAAWIICCLSCLLHLTSILILCGRTRRPSQPQCCMDHLLPFLSLASHFHSYFVWQDKETFTATVLDVNQGGLICRCQSLQAFIPISQLNREKDTWLSPEVSCCALLCCAVLCCAVLCCAVLCCAVLCCAVLWLRLLALPCHRLVHTLTERMPFGLRFICFPILRAECTETCCFSCILSTRLNRGLITWPSLEIIYSACRACHALHALYFVSVALLNSGRAEEWMHRINAGDSPALHAAHAARQAIMMMTMHALHALHALVIIHHSAWSAGHKALYNWLHCTCQLLVLLDAESCCVLPPLQYVLLPHRDSTQPQEAANHSLSKVQNAVCRCYMSFDLACLAGHIVHVVKTPSPS